MPISLRVVVPQVLPPILSVSIPSPCRKGKRNRLGLGCNESRHSRFELTKDTLLNVRLDSNHELAEVVVLSDKREAGIESTAMGAHEIPMTQIRHTPSVLGEADLLKTIQLMPGCASRYGRFCRHVCARGRSRPKPGYAGRNSSLQRRPPAGSILHLYAQEEHHTLQVFLPATAGVFRL